MVYITSVLPRHCAQKRPRGPLTTVGIPYTGYFRYPGHTNSTAESILIVSARIIWLAAAAWHLITAFTMIIHAVVLSEKILDTAQESRGPLTVNAPIAWSAAAAMQSVTLLKYLQT